MSSFEVKSAYQNALDCINEANSILTKNGVLDDEGNPAEFNISAASPLWLSYLAFGQMLSDFQQKLMDGVSCFDLAICPDSQIEACAQIAGIERKEGTPSMTTVKIIGVPDSTFEIEANSLLSDANNDLWFITKTLSFTPENEEQEVTITSLENGAFELATNSPLSLVVANSNVASITTTITSILGNNNEPLIDLRKRIITQNNAYNDLDLCAEAIADLTGIKNCVLTFNNDTVKSMTIERGNKQPAIELPPRSVYIVVEGTDAEEKLASTYLKYLNVPAPIGDTSSFYTTYSGQQIEVKYDKASTQEITIRITVRKNSWTTGYETPLRERIVALNGTKKIGENYDAVYLSTVLDDFPYADVLGVEIWNPDKQEWTNTTDIGRDVIAVFVNNASNITIVESEE